MTDISPNLPSEASSTALRERRRPMRGIVALVVLVTMIACAVGFTGGRAAAPSHKKVAPLALPSSATAQRGCGPATTPSMNMSSPDASLGQLIGREAGTALAGDSPLTVATAQVRALGNQVPVGARIDRCLNRITFTTSIASFVIEAVPPNNPDMTFRIAGLVNPTVVVSLNAQVRIEYINADHDEAHAFVITGGGQPLTFRPAGPPAFPGAAAGPIGDPTSAGHGARDVAFTARAEGTYRYLCPMPGHAEMGMYGNFVVQ